MRVVIEFIWGPRDGEVLAGDPGVGPPNEVTRYYRAFRDGRTQVSVWTPTEYAVGILSTQTMRSIESAIAVGCRFPGHVYRLIEACRVADEIRLRFRHVGPCE